MAIQQHPIPQDISNYRFRLIGDMTIKQFASLGISIVLSVIIYSSPLPFFFKYPLSFFFLVLGVGMAFVPVQGRTLDIWIVAFIKSIYSPTQYIWKHGQEGATNPVSATTSTTTAQPTIDSQMAVPNTPVVEITTPTPETVIPDPIRDSEPTSPPITPTLSIEPKTEQQLVVPLEQPTPDINPVLNTQTNVPLVKGGTEGDLNPQPETKTESFIPPTQTSTSTSQGEGLGVRSESPTPVPEQTNIVSEPKIEQPTPNTNSVPNTQTNTTLPIPFTPTSPNTLVGLTLTPDGQILDGVMVEIKNQGLTLRATKSNKLGQFLFARPLENGLYQIIAEKENYKFSEYSIELNGNIMNPLKIQAIN